MYRGAYGRLFDGPRYLVCIFRRYLSGLWPSCGFGGCWNIIPCEIKHENDNLVAATAGGDDAKRTQIGVSYLIENAGITDKAFTKLDVAKARGPPLLC